MGFLWPWEVEVGRGSSSENEGMTGLPVAMFIRHRYTKRDRKKNARKWVTSSND